MDKTRTTVRVLVALAWLALLPSCASGPPPGPSKAELAGAAARTIVIAPMNIVSPLPPDLEGSTKIVSRTMREYLEAHGKKVQRIASRAGRDLWQASMQEVKESGAKRNFDNAARVYARKIAEHIEFDALVVPSLFIQNAKMSFGKVRWDGAEERMEIRGGTGGSMFLGQQRGKMNVRAASLFMIILDPEGNTIQEKRQGLEPIEHLEMSAEKEGQYSGQESVQQRLVADVPPIEDKGAIRRGIAAAFVPFLPDDIPSNEAESASPPEAESGS